MELHISFYKTLSDLSRIPVYIDDTKRLDYPKGVVVNGTIYAEELNYPKKHDITYLLGSKYIPIRKEFWNIPDKAINESLQTIMITFGGDDARNMTPRIITMLNGNYPELNKKVIIGKAFTNTEQIQAFKDKTTEFIYYPDAEGMKKVMLESDIAISAAGQTLYELARLGVPTIAVAVADNQINNVRGWQKAGFIEYAGWWEDMLILENMKTSLEKLTNNNLRLDKYHIGKMFVDGKGAIRIIDEIMKKNEI